MTLEDQAKQPREGEQLDASKVEDFLRGALPELAGPVQVKQFPSGASNLTYLIQVGGSELVLRRPPFGTKARSAHDMGREYRVLSRLNSVFPYCPKPLAYCEDEDVLGAPFYVMERLHGIIVRRDLPRGMSLDSRQAAQLSRNLLDVQYELHHVDYKAAGLEELGKPEGYVERQVKGWNQRYSAARTEDVPECRDVMAWLEDKMPAESALVGIIHNDYKFDNVVLDPDNPLRIMGVLDWEMATLGDPLMDLGCSLAYWVQSDDPEELQAARMGPSHLEGMLTRQELIDRYAQKARISLDNFDFYYAFGLFRLAVIAQQIYYRYIQGQTRDERFKSFGRLVNVLVNVAGRVMERSRL